MTAASTPNSSAARRMVLRLLAIVLVIFLALACLVWRAPIWVGELLTQFRLYASGIHSRYMVVDGDEVHYIEGGSGPPVVLIHGLGSRAQQDWVELAPRLVN